MVTHPSTHGVFEDRIREICATSTNTAAVLWTGEHERAGLTTSPRRSAPMSVANLHKTFAILTAAAGRDGPIAVAKHLAPFLPGMR
jgi:glycine dehydrogenase